MINLAPLRFARVLSKYNGPIEKIEYRRITVAEKPMYQANAYLSRRLNLTRPKTQIFGNADGTGSHTSAMVARHKAVSEAIERWALYYLKQSGMDKMYGFHEDSTSNGMAAYPGLFATQARKRAQMEAVERFCLVGWWNGDLEGNPFDLDGSDQHGLQIENPIDKSQVVIVWRKTSHGFHCYGFGAGKSLWEATHRATIERERSEAALAIFHVENPGFEEDDLETLNSFMERRVVYYSLPAGHRQFRSRLKEKARGIQRTPTRPAIDIEIKGPWSRYATVWRVLYPMPTKDYLDLQSNFFFW